METETFILTPRESALIRVMRSMGHGTIERLAVSDGQPAVVTMITQRVDLTKANELSACMSLVPVNMEAALAQSPVADQGDFEPEN